MYAGLVASVILHIAMLAWAFWSVQSSHKLDLPDVATIEAEIITIAEFTRLKQGDPRATQLEAKKKDAPDPKVAKRETPKAKPEAAPPPPAAQPPPAEPEKKKTPEPAPPKPQASDPIADKLAALTPPPPPTPTAEEKKKLEEERKKKAKKKAEEEAKKKKAAAKKRKEREAKKRREREKKRKAKAKKDFKRNMRALLDKTPEPRGAPRAAAEPTQPTDYTGPTAGEREGSGTQLTAREEDLLKAQINAQLRGCWRLPGAGGGTQTPVVTLRWTLRPDGSLSSTPRIEQGRSDTAYKIAAENAIRAVTQCAPFDLPAKYYESWKTITWDFDPQHML